MTEQPPGFGSSGSGPSAPQPAPPNFRPPRTLLRVLSMLGLGSLYWMLLAYGVNLLGSAPGLAVLLAVVALPVMVFLTRSWIAQNRAPQVDFEGNVQKGSSTLEALGTVAMWLLAAWGCLVALGVVFLTIVFIACAFGGGPRFEARALYAAVMVASVLAGLALSWARRKPLPLSRGERLAVTLGALIGSSVGAKLPFLFRDLEALRSGAAWLEDGRTITWGLMGGYLGVEVGKWSMGVAVKTGDSLAPAVALSVAVGRLGCWIAGCCGGRPSSLPWAIPDDHGVARHPTQLYELAFHAAMVVALLWAEKKSLFERQRVKAYLGAYFVFRLLTDPLRDESVGLVGPSFYQQSSAVFLVIMALLWWRDARPGTPVRSGGVTAG